PNSLGAQAHVACHLILLQLSQRVTELIRGVPVRARKVPSGRLHLLLQLLNLFQNGFVFTGKLLRLLPRHRRGALSELLHQLVSELLLSAGYLLALARKLAQLLSTLTLTHPRDQVASLIKTLRRAPGFRFTLRRSRGLRRSRVLHVFGRLLQ